MKKLYEAPTIEKIAFCYRDQVVAASGGGEVTPTNPTVGQYYGNQDRNTSGRKYYLVEALGWDLCSYT